jgi:hypothetical protein
MTSSSSSLRIYQISLLKAFPRSGNPVIIPKPRPISFKSHKISKVFWDSDSDSDSDSGTHSDSLSLSLSLALCVSYTRRRTNKSRRGFRIRRRFEAAFTLVSLSPEYYSCATSTPRARRPDGWVAAFSARRPPRTAVAGTSPETTLAVAGAPSIPLATASTP